MELIKVSLIEGSKIKIGQPYLLLDKLTLPSLLVNGSRLSLGDRSK